MSRGFSGQQCPQRKRGGAPCPVDGRTAGGRGLLPFYVCSVATNPLFCCLRPPARPPPARIAALTVERIPWEEWNQKRKEVRTWLWDGAWGPRGDHLRPARCAWEAEGGASCSWVRLWVANHLRRPARLKRRQRGGGRRVYTTPDALRHVGCWNGGGCYGLLVADHCAGAVTKHVVAYLEALPAGRRVLGGAGRGTGAGVNGTVVQRSWQDERPWCFSHGVRPQSGKASATEIYSDCGKGNGGLAPAAVGAFGLLCGMDMVHDTLIP